jgi:hypothetical protein
MLTYKETTCPATVSLRCVCCVGFVSIQEEIVWNEDIRDRVGVAPIEEKLVQHRLRWFGHVQRRPPEASVRSGVLDRVGSVRRGRGRPKLTWDEAVKRDLKEWDITKELVVDRSAWRLAINVPETWPFLFLLCFCVLVLCASPTLVSCGFHL